MQNKNYHYFLVFLICILIQRNPQVGSSQHRFGFVFDENFLLSFFYLYPFDPSKGPSILY